jgi:hypothetical protein
VIIGIPIFIVNRYFDKIFSDIGANNPRVGFDRKNAPACGALATKARWAETDAQPAASQSYPY